MDNKVIKLTSTFTKSSENTDTLIIEGFANTATVDRSGDIIIPDAWSKGGLDNYKKNPIILAFHNYAMPIGKAVDLSVSSMGLHITAAISKAAGQIYDLIQEGVVSTFSVGFMVKDAAYDAATDIFVIKDLELLEVSVVSVPANADSTFAVRKQMGNTFMGDKTSFINKQSSEASTTENSTVENSEDKSLTQDVVKKLEHIEELLNKQMGEKIVAENNETISATVITAEAEKIQKEVEARVLAALEAREKAARERAESEAAASEALKLKEALGDLHSQLKEKSEELEAMRRNKMQFSDGNRGTISSKEIDTAIMVSTIMKKSLADTKFGRQLLEKAGSDNNSHIPSTLWEREFSQRAFDDLRQQLVIAPQFRTVQMNALNLTVPITSDIAADATWVARTDYGSTDSSGSAVTSALTEATMKAHKLAAHEYLIDEEEEDAIISVAQFIRDSMLRRMGRTWDKALLRGANNEGGGDPINGIITVADTANLEVAMDGALATDKVTVEDLQAVRRKLGVWGLDPMNLVYIVSTEAMYDLLDDPDFRTMDLVGSNATIIRGQIGAVNGSPVIVSGEFEAKSASKVPVVCLNSQAFIMGELRSLRFERDRDVLKQSELLVASTRVGFLNTISGKGAAILKYPAA